MNIRPLNDNIVVREIEPEVKTPGGIIIPENSKDKRAIPMGVVVEAGTSNIVKQGQVVIYPRSSPFVFDLGGGKSLLVLKAEDVLGIMEMEDGKKEGSDC
jgi:chaperonin GroES